MAKITLQQLKDKDACASQTELFEKLFGESVEVTTELAIEMADKFEWDWAAANLLSDEGWKIYQETDKVSWKIYDEAIAPSRKSNDEAYAAAYKIYKEATDSALKIYYETIDSIGKNYDEVIATALKTHDEALAASFAELYNKEND